MDYQEMIIFILEILGTIAFAASGAMVGVKQKMDILGVCVLGVITAVGGGMTRDVILGICPPSVFKNPVYALVATVTSCIVFFMLYLKKSFVKVLYSAAYEKMMLIMDSVGLGIFTVMGVNTGINLGYHEKTFLLIFLGTITGVGGGLLRDVIAGVPPYIFVRHIYACASIAGAMVCVWIQKLFGKTAAILLGAVTVVLIRYLAARYRWNLPKVCLDENNL